MKTRRKRSLTAPTSSLPPEELLYTADELALMLKVPKSTLYGWRYHKKGPPGIAVGRYLRYRKLDVERWLEGGGDAPED